MRMGGCDTVPKLGIKRVVSLKKTDYYAIKRCYARGFNPRKKKRILRTTFLKEGYAFLKVGNKRAFVKVK